MQQHRRNSVAECGGPVHWRLGTRKRAGRQPPRSPVAAKDATSAAAMGGVDAVCAAGKAEGQVTLIATPKNWANYGQMMDDFTAKYGIKVQSDQPDTDSQGEINAATQLRRRRQPDIFDLGSVVAAKNTSMYAPYEPATWADIPREQGPDRPLDQQLHRLRVDRL